MIDGRPLQTTVAVLAVSSTMFLIYGAAFEQQRSRLIESAKGQARLMEAVARFDAKFSTDDHPQGARGATLSQIQEAFRYHGDYQGSQQFVLGESQGDEIVFILSQTRASDEFPGPVPFGGERPVPMHRALRGEFGIIVGPDYQGTTVLASYEPVTDFT